MPAAEGCFDEARIRAATMGFLLFLFADCDKFVSLTEDDEDMPAMDRRAFVAANHHGVGGVGRLLAAMEHSQVSGGDGGMCI